MRRARLIEVKEGWGGNNYGVPVSNAARMPAFLYLQQRPEDILRRLKLAMVGCGSVGGALATHAARCGVGGLLLVDPKRYKAESLCTHDIAPPQIGRAKALDVARRCKAIHPAAKVWAYQGYVQELPIDILAKVDYVMLATDNLAVEVAVGQSCLRVGKPLIQAAVHGDTLVAQIRHWTNRDPDGPCPACSFGNLEWSQLNQQLQFSCEGHHGPSQPGQVVGPETRSVSHLCAMAAALGMNRLLTLALSLGDAKVGDSVLEYCGYSNRTISSPLNRNEHCRCEHGRWGIQDSPRPLRECSLRELAEAAQVGAEQDITFALSDAAWAEQGLCQCPEPALVRRFVLGQPANLGKCRRCHAPIQPQPFYTHPVVSAGQLGKALERPLGALRAGATRSVLVRAGSRAVLIRNSESPKLYE